MSLEIKLLTIQIPLVPVGGLTDKQNYYIIKIDDTSFRVAKSKSYARQGFAVDITSQGTGGDHKFSVINDADHVLIEPDDDFGFNESFTNSNHVRSF